jgi:hypothetical protein
MGRTVFMLLKCVSEYDSQQPMSRVSWSEFIICTICNCLKCRGCEVHSNFIAILYSDWLMLLVITWTWYTWTRIVIHCILTVSFGRASEEKSSWLHKLHLCVYVICAETVPMHGFLHDLYWSTLFVSHSTDHEESQCKRSGTPLTWLATVYSCIPAK